MSLDERSIKYIDLFAGAGGLSEGFQRAGYKPIAHVEMDSDACNTLRTREAYYYLQSRGKRAEYLNYLSGNITRDQLYAMVPQYILDSVICEAMSKNSMPEIFQKIDQSLKIRGETAIDLIIGGPPCQAYSTVGRSRKDMSRDPRNDLYKMYFMALDRYSPEMFVFENVPGLLNAGKGKYYSRIINGFESKGYQVEQQILNASDYGVLQNRRRVILIGWKKGSQHHYPKLTKMENSYQVSELFDDLPALTPGERKKKYLDGANSRYLRDTGIRKDDDILTWHVARKNLERDREIYRMAIHAWYDNNEHRRLKYTDIPEQLATHANKQSFLDRFKVVAGDMSTAQTMVAHISKDGHYYIHPDINQARSISVREAARIQSFPDDYFFEGSRTAAFRQIGNAVPPILANTIAIAMKEQFLGD